MVFGAKIIKQIVKIYLLQLYETLMDSCKRHFRHGRSLHYRYEVCECYTGDLVREKLQCILQIIFLISAQYVTDIL